MSVPVPVVFEAADVQWLRDMMDNSMWPGAISETVTRIRMALGHAADTDDDGAHVMIPQDRISATDFLDT